MYWNESSVTRADSGVWSTKAELEIEGSFTSLYTNKGDSKLMGNRGKDGTLSGRCQPSELRK